MRINDALSTALDLLDMRTAASARFEAAEQFTHQRSPTAGQAGAWSYLRAMPIALYGLTALDCPDPLALAEFYSRLTGWPIAPQKHANWAQLDAGGAGATLAFQQVEQGDYHPPEWPGQDRPQRAHFDFDVADLDVAERAVLEIGARKHDIQPRPQSFRVFLDPVGHPFCLVKA